VSAEPKIALDCPYCGASIYETLSWFKKTYSTCPSCDKGLAADQFSAVLADLEQAMDASIEEMVHGTSHGCCCCGNRTGTCESGEQET
jgi:hypothetical protein